MSDTPRTGNGQWCHADFARELERELNAAKADLARVTAERDEARREVCKLDSNLHTEHGNLDPSRFGARALAAQRGWDCFKENTNGS